MEEDKKPNKRDKTISIRVDEETYELYNLMAKTFKTSTSDLLRDMLSIGVDIFKRGTQDNGNH